MNNNMVSTVIENKTNAPTTLYLFGRRTCIGAGETAEFPGSVLDACRPAERAVLTSCMAKRTLELRMKVRTGVDDSGKVTYVETPIAAPAYEQLHTTIAGEARKVGRTPFGLPIIAKRVGVASNVISVENPTINKLAESLGMKVEDPLEAPEAEEIGADLKADIGDSMVEHAINVEQTLEKFKEVEEQTEMTDEPDALPSEPNAVLIDDTDGAAIEMPNTHEQVDQCVEQKDWAGAAKLLSDYLHKEITAGQVRAAKDKSFEALVEKFSK